MIMINTVFMFNFDLIRATWFVDAGFILLNSVFFYSTLFYSTFVLEFLFKPMVEHMILGNCFGFSSK